MFSSASRATPTIFVSVTERRSANGLTQPQPTRNSICCGDPPAIALLIAQAASFFMSKSAVCKRLITGGKRPQSATAWICSRFPAVMFEIVQHVSFRIVFFVCERSVVSAGKAPQWRRAWVWTSSPVAMFPITRSAGVCTSGEVCPSSSTIRGQMFAPMTAPILSLVPSDKYDNAQHASVRISQSVDWMSWLRMPRAGDTHSSGGGGFPRQRFDKVHVAFLIMDVFSDSRSTVMIGTKPPLCNTRSRKFGESPAMLPNAQTACSRTSSLVDCKRFTKTGKAPWSTTTFVWSAEPEAMFVSTHAASNCRSGFDTSFKNCTIWGTTPDWMTSWIGGLFSTLRILRNCCVALN
mmetsp:Transcript_110251/g.311027  ORF Transcript_110251/g.311027 Transcript_110251/m.311027 type:complete len:350 (+) Transcript_110251:466-1515(+)